MSANTPLEKGLAQGDLILPHMLHRILPQVYLKQNGLKSPFKLDLFMKKVEMVHVVRIFYIN